ncbi:unnamed protein product [Phytophthora lilii]|uniref:Unnamed protein product n=1 Tax=Phytophthora lilii TaxID=2077276 RepID=A0A9W6T9W7_9STRA|nr:unnamed protein product [Phytophthora lilii]
MSKAARSFVPGNQRDDKKGKKKQSATIAGAPPQALSGTVKMLCREVAAIKRDQQVRCLSHDALYVPLTFIVVTQSQKQAHEAAEKEQQELKRTQQQALCGTSGTRRSCSNNKADEIPGLSDWEVTTLKKYFQSEEVKNR